MLSAKPNAIVVAHNHPASSNKPSVKDDNFTAQIQIFCSMNNIKFYDHLIIGTEGCFSYRNSGRMTSIYKEFTVSHLLADKGLL